MSIFSKRNALVGFVTLKALERRRQRRKRSAAKLAGFIVLGVLSVGVLAALAAIVMRRQREAEAEGEGQHIEGYAVSDEAVFVEAPSPDVYTVDPDTSEYDPAA
jgi:hypothetical protein